MPGEKQRYEVAVKLSNERVVQYHNINTGLFKFHRFIKSKFGQNWNYYTVRRISNKEIIDTYTNDVWKEIEVIRLYLPKQRNPRGTGYFLSFPFQREEAELNRNCFFANKVILEDTEEYTTIPYSIFKKAMERAKNDLKAYYEEKGHVIFLSEIELMEIKHEKLLLNVRVSKATEPVHDYP